MVVDDNASFCEFVALVLKQSGMEVVAASDGASALAAAFTRVPDLVVTDLEMPGTNGVEMIRTLRGDTRTAHVPIVALTGASTDVVQAARDAGCNQVVTKPCSPWRLLQTVNRYVGRRKEDRTGDRLHQNLATPDRRNYSRRN